MSSITLLIELAQNCPISSSVQFLIQKLFWTSDEVVKIPSCVAPQTWYIHNIQR